MLMPPPGGLIPNDQSLRHDQSRHRISAEPPRTSAPGGPSPGLTAPGLTAPAARGLLASGLATGGLAGGFLPVVHPVGMLPGDPPGRPVHDNIPARVHAMAKPALPGLAPGRLAVLGTHCPGLRVEQVLHHDNKSVLAAGYIGEEPVVIKMPADADPLWRLRQQHEIGVYLIFAEHPPPVRVPRLVHTDGESIVIMERIDGTPLDTGRYPARPLTDTELHATTALIGTLHNWRPVPLEFGPVFAYRERIARYHAAGYFGDGDRRALDHLLDRCGPPSQLNHGDPLPGNILRTPDGGWALLDWEFTGLFLPGFDLAMLRILLAKTPAAADHIEAIVAGSGQLDPYLVNLAVVLSRERHMHVDLPEDHPLRISRIPVIEDLWRQARERIHAAAWGPQARPTSQAHEPGPRARPAG